MAEPIAVAPIKYRFECQPGCVNCCARPGEVYLTPEDRRRIARHLELSVREFTKQYCAPDDGEGLRLRIPSEDSCLFLGEDGCRIHPVKPLQCQAFPFWPENVETRKAWKSLSGYCPGIGVGEILAVEDVRTAAQECADAFPD